GGLFLLTWAASALTGWVAFNSEQLGQRQDPVTFAGYLAEADFWNRSFQNWQSEMLAVGSMAIFAVYLRQRGSPESKPVGVAHADTGQTGGAQPGTPRASSAMSSASYREPATWSSTAAATAATATSASAQRSCRSSSCSASSPNCSPAVSRAS